MRGHFGGGGRHWGGGFGWVFPAMILGRLIAEALDRQGQAPAPPPAPAPPGPEPVAGTRCANCGRGVEPGFSFCPHCGQSPARRECRYCGREVRAEQRTCPGCGAPPPAIPR